MASGTGKKTQPLIWDHTFFWEMTTTSKDVKSSGNTSEVQTFTMLSHWTCASLTKLLTFYFFSSCWCEAFTNVFFLVWRSRTRLGRNCSWTFSKHSFRTFFPGTFSFLVFRLGFSFSEAFPCQQLLKQNQENGCWWKSPQSLKTIVWFLFFFNHSCSFCEKNKK